MSHRALGPQFFHGSWDDLEPGSIVTPDDSEKVVSTDPEVADAFGHRYRVEPVDPDDVHGPFVPDAWTSSRGFRVLKRERDND